MATLYITEQGAKLKKEDKRFVIEKDDVVLLEIPEFKVDKVFIFGNIQITTQAMKFLLTSGIDTSFFTIYGKFIGKLQPVESKNVLLRIKQFEKYKDEEFKLNISKKFVEGKINNAKILLLRYQRNHPEVNFSNHIEELEKNLEELKRKNSISSVMGLEGRCSAIYFECFGNMILKNFEFKERTPRNVKDPVNSLLSFGYSILTSEVFSILQGIGFDPYLGFLHTVDYGRPALALDLMEEFRHVIVDRLVLEIINKEILKEDDFVEDEEEKIRLNEKAIKEFLTQYERRILTEITYEEETMNYRKLIQYQIRKFEKTILEEQEYIPYEMR
ncbi:MAG: CRISPR-associated endonuclease Cas1 [Candidatus Omnitrophica bacterium]|nr:CRISPR-associated endonuclease Cas1 [Candidatus Omnitrophota bacterium]MCM8808313.1 CRISPR-associated endonuclease Cas1 [Candidatus Omnitrophota bacterium]